MKKTLKRIWNGTEKTLGLHDILNILILLLALAIGIFAGLNKVTIIPWLLWW